MLFQLKPALIITWLVLTSVAGQSIAQGKGASSWPSKRIADGAVLDSAKWCGTSAVVWQAIAGGIYISSSDHSKPQQLIKGAWAEKPFCSEDGGVVMFSERGSRKAISAGDPGGKIQSVPCWSKDMLYVPRVNKIFGLGSNCDSIELPSGKVIEVTAVKGVNVNEYYPPRILDFDAKSEKVVLRYKRKVADTTVTDLRIGMLDPKRPRMPELSRVPSTMYGEKVHPFKSELYFLAKGDEELQLDLHRMDLKVSSLPSGLARSNIHRYDISRSGKWALLTGGTSRTLVVTDALDQPGIEVSAAHWDSGPAWSAKGDQLLLMKLDDAPMVEGPEGPPPNSGIYVLTKP